jgi:membrane protease YdiL (CAAX protease family)
MNRVDISPPQWLSRGSFHPARWLPKGGLFLLFFVVASAVFAILTLAPYLPERLLLRLHGGLTVTLLVSALLLRASQRGRAYWPVCYVLFVAAAAVLLSGLYADDLLRLLGQRVTTPRGMATAKFAESLLRVVPILVLMPLLGFLWRSLYLTRGRVAVWLGVGLAAWVVFPVIAYLPLRHQEGLLAELLPLAPWILLFVFSNALMEELLFRGLFLRAYEPFLGRVVSNGLSALVFTLMHTQVTYAPQMLQFLLIVVALSLVWGWLIQKTDSLWGAVLFHAAGDLLIIVPMFASM